MKADTPSARKAGFIKLILLYVFAIAISLYPPLAQYAQPFILFSFAAILLSVLYDIFFLNQLIPNSILFKVVGVLALVYFVWLFIAVLYENDISYALQDSFGFIIYLFMMPILFVFIYLNKYSQKFIGLILNLSTLIAGISSGILVWYYLSFGSVQEESLVALNAYIKSLGLNWMIDNNAGFLGVYTFTAHILLLGIGLAFYQFYVQEKRSYFYLIFLFAMGILADGHRALVVAMLLLIILLIPLIKQKLPVKKLIFYIVILAIPLLSIILYNLDWIQERFNFSSSDESTYGRFLQIPSLLDKFIESPILGNGFGSFATIIRNEERPFLYEVDFLATLMKLGIAGGFLYFGSYLFMLEMARRYGGALGYILFSVGISFFFYMGTNGGLSMSSDCAIFHMFLFILISFSLFEIESTQNLKPASLREGKVA